MEPHRWQPNYTPKKRSIQQCPFSPKQYMFYFLYAVYLNCIHIYTINTIYNMHNFVSCAYTGNSQILFKVVDVKLVYPFNSGFYWYVSYSCPTKHRVILSLYYFDSQHCQLFSLDPVDREIGKGVRAKIKASTWAFPLKISFDAEKNQDKSLLHLFK